MSSNDYCITSRPFFFHVYYISNQIIAECVRLLVMKSQRPWKKHPPKLVLIQTRKNKDVVGHRDQLAVAVVQVKPRHLL